MTRLLCAFLIMKELIQCSCSYTDIKKWCQYVLNMKKQPIVDDSEIDLVSQIPYPETFSSSSFPPRFENILILLLIIKFPIKRKISDELLRFILFVRDKLKLDIDQYIEYANRMMVWFYILNEYAAIKCSKTSESLFLYDFS